MGDGDHTTRASVIEMADRGIDFYGSWNKAGDNPAAHGIHRDYDAAAFLYDQRSNEMICPEGKRLVLCRTHALEGDAVQYVFAARREDCRSCSKRRFCTPKNAMAKHGRTVTVQLEDARVEAFQQKMQTAEAKAIYRQRSPVAEFPHAWLKDKLKWVRVRCRGLLKVQCEALWACLAHNLQRYFKLCPAVVAA
ncbi:MAG: transposase [Terriglobales bacterium]